MNKLQVKISEYPEQVTEPGRHTIKAVKGPQETRFGLALILIVLTAKREERSLFVPYSTEVSTRTNLARLVQAFSTDTDSWVQRQVDVTIDDEGRRTIESVTK
jgi:hypothetical protein